MSLRLNAPLCPAGHLPLKGGDRLFGSRRPPVDVDGWRKPIKYPISRLEGEMAGKPEGGALALPFRGFHRGDIA
ncbi:lytic murein transglycosylase [Mesorhizobium sp. B2-4-19]|nr:lytic murein transglycosylase [Mesorhizobium sp. B2-4-19]